MVLANMGIPMHSKNGGGGKGYPCMGRGTPGPKIRLNIFPSLDNVHIDTKHPCPTQSIVVMPVGRKNPSCGDRLRAHMHQCRALLPLASSSTFGTELLDDVHVHVLG